MAIANRALSAKFNGLGLFTEYAKSFGFGNKKKKSNYKTKSSGSQTRCKRIVSLPALLAIAETLCAS